MLCTTAETGLVSNPHPFVCLARDAIALYVESGQAITPLESCYEQFEILRQQSGVFVTLKKSGELRGCMGTLEPACANMALEIIENAISAAFRCGARFLRPSDGWWGPSFSSITLAR